MGRQTAYRYVAIPDIILPDGTVHRGHRAAFMQQLTVRRHAVSNEIRQAMLAPLREGRDLTPGELAHVDSLATRLRDLEARIRLLG
jgi:hypothetical protein